MKTKSAGKVHCNEATKYICENLDERLDSPKCRAIKKHLQTCATCSNDLANLKKIIALYRGAPSPRLSNAVEKKIFTALKLEF
ncbi:MAG: zf-HC2 domain-containing protein [Bacteroidota bacterium]